MAYNFINTISREDMARERFDSLVKSNKSKVKISFDEMRDLFKTDISFSDVAEKCSVTRARIQQIYDEYFKDFYVCKCGRDRQKYFSEKKYANEARKDPRIQMLFDAITIPFKYSLVKNSFRSLWSKSEIVINNKQCKIINAVDRGYRKFNPRSLTRYKKIAFTSHSLNGNAYLIVFTETYRAFVIPTFDMEQIRIYLPDQSVIRKYKRKTDYRFYVNRWESLL